MNGLKPGTKLHGGNYTVIRILGQGGFGITYLAHDEVLDRDVAIKEFFLKDMCDRAIDQETVKVLKPENSIVVTDLKNKFLKEARRIAKLNQSGIIKIFTAFEERNTAYYVMEYIEGESLSDKVKRGGIIDCESARQYISQISKSLQYLHSNNLAHLDVKPANIMIRNSDNAAILIDFGISKQYDNDGVATSTTITGVSHGYAPLEQYSGSELSGFSPASDIYSLAATLYYIITGMVPPRAPELATSEIEFPDLYLIASDSPYQRECL